MNRLKWQWDENPMLPLLIFLAAGIISGEAFQPALLAALAAILLLLLLLLTMVREKHILIKPVRRTILAGLLPWIAGAGLTVFRTGKESLPNHQAFSAEITMPGEVRENGSLRCLARILFLRKKDGSWQKTAGSALLVFRGQAAAGFRSGQRIVATGSLRGIPAPAIPGEFNARQWYRSQGISWQAKVNSFQTVSSGNSFHPANIAFTCRRLLEKRFTELLPEADDAAMMSALLLGIRRKMDPELREAFSAAGLTHILAVSGMHVALIYSFLAFLLSGLKKIRGGQVVYSILLAALLWFYAMVTGLSPSVLRAVCLFTIMQLSDLLRKPALPLNNLCFAGIVMLVCDENLISDLGFQLSFAAVYGILSFQPALSDLWQPGHWLLRALKDNLTVTLAASLSTLPLILIHFHRFPVYFLFSNLLAVPFSNLLIYAGIVLLTFSGIPLLGPLLAKAMHYAILLLNGFVSLVNEFPFSSLNHLFPDAGNIFYILSALFFLQLWLTGRRILLFRFFLLSVFCGFAWNAAGRLMQENPVQKQYALFYRRQWYILETFGKSGRLHPAGISEDLPLFLQTGLKLSSMKHSALNGSFLPADSPGKKSQVFQFKGKTLLLLGHYFTQENPPVPRQVDILITGNIGEKSLEKALHLFRPAIIWSEWKAERLLDFRKKHPACPPVLCFREQKFRQIESEAERDPAGPAPESGNSRTN